MLYGHPWASTLLGLTQIEDELKRNPDDIPGDLDPKAISDLIDELQDVCDVSFRD